MSAAFIVGVFLLGYWAGFVTFYGLCLAKAAKG